MPFLTLPKISCIDESHDRPIWRVEDDFTYHSDRYNIDIVVPKGFLTDLCSCHVGLVTWWLLGERANNAGIVHDRIYHFPPKQDQAMLPRNQCDNILYDIAKESGVPDTSCFILWSGVYLGGWSAYGVGKELKTTK